MRAGAWLGRRLVVISFPPCKRTFKETDQPHGFVTKIGQEKPDQVRLRGCVRICPCLCGVVSISLFSHRRNRKTQCSFLATTRPIAGNFPSVFAAALPSRSIGGRSRRLPLGCRTFPGSQNRKKENDHNQRGRPV